MTTRTPRSPTKNLVAFGLFLWMVAHIYTHIHIYKHVSSIIERLDASCSLRIACWKDSSFRMHITVEFGVFEILS